MEISRTKRMKIMKDMESVTSDCKYEIPADPYGMILEFSVSAMASRYRILQCISLLGYHGVSLTSLDVPFLCMELLSDLYPAETDEEYLGIESKVDAVIDELDSMNMGFLDWMVKNSDWKNCSVSTLEETEQLTDEEILMFKVPICFLWGMYISLCQYEAEEFSKRQLPDRVIERLSRLGLAPDTYFSYTEFGNVDTLLLYNPKIMQLWKLCQENPSFKQDALYQEIERLLSYEYVLDRYFYGLDIHCSFEKGGFYIGHCMGSICIEQMERVGRHQINPKILVFMLLADSAADELLKKMEDRKESEWLANAG